MQGEEEEVEGTEGGEEEGEYEDRVAEGNPASVVVEEALFIKGSSASISSPPNAVDSTGLLL